ncbi:hypothetical protein [Enterococcus sp. C76]|uniref:hypothetical protein n=1 Tax=Enterococcus TaxID=1350 RepID=UPI00349FED43
MANISVNQSEITSLIDLEKTYGEWRFIKEASDREVTNSEDETREAIAVRFDAVSSVQGRDFRIEVLLEDNPMIDLSSLSYYDLIEIIGMRVFSYNSNGQIIEKIRALDVKKKSDEMKNHAINNSEKKTENMKNEMSKAESKDKK